MDLSARTSPRVAPPPAKSHAEGHTSSRCGKARLLTAGKRSPHLAGGAAPVGGAGAGGAAPGGDCQLRDDLHALLGLVLALQRAQQRVQPAVLLILYHRLVPARSAFSMLRKLTGCSLAAALAGCFYQCYNM